jgi:hypothetical protein
VKDLVRDSLKKLVRIQIERGREKVVYVIISANQVSLRPIALITMKSGLTVATGGNIEAERTKPRIMVL